MQTFIAKLSILIPLLPLVAGLLIPILGKRIKENVYKIGLTAQVAAFFTALLALYQVSVGGPIQIGPLSFFGGNGIIPFGLFIDRLTAVMMVLVTSVSIVIHIFASRYLQEEPGYTRFYTLLSLITFVLLALVASPNLLMLFVFWQLLSWTLYLLLAYNITHLPSAQAAFKTLIILRIGDVFFLGGVILAYLVFGTLDFPLLFERAAAGPVSLSLLPGGLLTMDAVTAITLLIFIGAMSKSVQFPLHVWLPDTMHAPSPVSALMHAGIVNSGGFLLSRLAPLYGLSPTSLHVVFAVGALTTLIGALIMLTVNDVKKMLGYSTIAQMGYMIMECGLGAFALAIFHFIAHGLFKATLFLSSASTIQAAREEPKFPHSVNDAKPPAAFSPLTWGTGLFTTLLLPLLILLAAHDLFHIPLEEAHGAVIFLFFSWVTSSQAIISLYRLNAVASWKVAGAMVLALIFIVFTYLWAGELFTHFLFPEPGLADYYFQVAALPPFLFDSAVIVATLLIVLVWVNHYAEAHGRKFSKPVWMTDLQERSYVLCINRFYIDTLYVCLNKRMIYLANLIDKRVLARIP
ncbi:MAG TPA: NADH-quinone oxidoreductase subunit L [Nitrospiria bacterium]|nr:NADH-quinone oxidoreductase subunit L [Candidatus Manganitrophaceae bacterium]HIL34763.1 NADH-quinone oxidoreductase subunit L [Candidatus Manganitrophaceae bacterium]